MKTYGLADGSMALRAMQDRRVMGKIVLTP